MKKLIVSATAVVILVGVSCLLGTVRGQGNAGAAQAAAPHKIALIDMAHIFKEYKKFQVLRDDLKAEIEQSDALAKKKAEDIKELSTTLKSFTQGSQDYADREKQLAKATSDFETFRKLAQRDFLRKESQIYKQIYLEVTEMVQRYAKHYGYTLVMRFSRENVDEVTEPGDIIKSMNRQVVYYQNEDDITQPVLDYLNKKYSAAAGPPAAGPQEAPAGKRRN